MRTGVRRLDWPIAVLSYILVAGFFFDGWSHYHETIDNFFEPAHGVIYGAGLLIVLVAAFAAWRKAVPPAYRLMLVGVAVFFAGGAADMLWHLAFGVESGIDVILSPTHLTIGLGMMLVISCPIRALMERNEPSTLAEQLPMLVALAAMLSAIHFGTQFALDPGANASNRPLPIGAYSSDMFTILSITYYKQGFGVLIVLFQALLMAGFALFAVRHFALRPGALTLLLVLANLPAAAMLSDNGAIFPALVTMSLAGGIAGDLCVAYLQPNSARPWQMRALAFAVPSAFVAAYVVLCALFYGGVWWDWNVTLGAIVEAGGAGLGLSFLFLPRERTA